MALGIFQKVSAVPKMANVANNITRSPDHILICSYKSIFWGDTFKRRIKNHIKPIRLPHQASQYGMRRGDMAGQGRQQCRAFALPVAAPLLPCGQSSRDSQHRRFLFPLKFHFQWLQPEQDKPTAACLRVRIKTGTHVLTLILY